MCYKLPGPRCSHHATLAYQRARVRWDHVERYGTDADRLDAMEALKKAQLDYEMTPVGQRELESLIRAGLDRDGALALQLERGKTLRAAALAQIKAEDRGDLDNHSLIENIEASIPNDEGFPRETVINLIRHHVAQYGKPIGSGRNRVVFDRKDGTVVKIPKNWDGESDNNREANWSSDEVPLAQCHSESVGSGDSEMTVLVMEKVTPVQGFKGLPDWVSWVDCQQVGYTKDERLVAYDL